MKEKLIIEVEVRDVNGKLYKDKNGNKITSVARFEIDDYGEELVGITCEHIAENFKAICREGSKVNIDVMYYDSVTNTYPFIYSYYGAEKRFVKH